MGVEPEPEAQADPEPEPAAEPPIKSDPVVVPSKEAVSNIVKAAPNAAPKKPVLAEAKPDDDYKDDIVVSEAPKLTPLVEVDPDGTEIVYPTYMTNLCIKARTHDKLKNYKTINCSSKKYKVDDGQIQMRLEELSQKDIAPRGHFVVDDSNCFAYCLVKEPFEWRAALRINTDNVNDAQKVLNFIQGKTQMALGGVDRIQTFNWDRNFQALVMEIRNANMYSHFRAYVSCECAQIVQFVLGAFVLFQGENKLKLTSL